jgi:hypothetical protein
MNRGGDADLRGEFVGCLAQRGEQAVRKGYGYGGLERA